MHLQYGAYWTIPPISLPRLYGTQQEPCYRLQEQQAISSKQFFDCITQLNLIYTSQIYAAIFLLYLLD